MGLKLSSIFVEQFWKNRTKCLDFKHILKTLVPHTVVVSGLLNNHIGLGHICILCISEELLQFPV